MNEEDNKLHNSLVDDQNRTGEIGNHHRLLVFSFIITAIGVALFQKEGSVPGQVTAILTVSLLISIVGLAAGIISDHYAWLISIVRLTDHRKQAQREDLIGEFEKKLPSMNKLESVDLVSDVISSVAVMLALVGIFVGFIVAAYLKGWF